MVSSSARGVRSSMRSGQSSATSEVGQSLASMWGTEQECIAALWVLHYELVQGHSISSGLLDSLSGRLGELQCANIHLRNLEQSLIISHSRYDNQSLSPTFRFNQ